MPIEAFISRISSAGPPEKRPPHIGLESDLRLIVALLALLLVGGCDRQKAPDQQGTEQGALVKGVDYSHAGKSIPDIELRNADDQPARLSDEIGEPMLVNLWASWCAPCVKELPTLERLAGSPGAPRVIALSQDMAPRASVDAFADKLKLEHAEVWQDAKMVLSGALNARVLPTTIYYGADGKERWRYVGDLDWTGPEAARLLAGGKNGTG
jgi:thiol-disulfide isomerase/thioredoxin